MECPEMFLLDLFLREKLPVGEGEERICPKVPAYVRRSQFRLPNRAQVGKTSPLLLSTLSPDTCDNDWAWNWVGSIQRVHPGLFAFHFRRIRGYCENLCIQERAWQKENGKTVGPTVLFFGCRNKDQDYIYRLVEASYCRESCYFFSLVRLYLVTSPLLPGRSWRLGSRMACSHSTLLSVETR